MPVDGSQAEFANRLENPTGLSPAWTLLPFAYVVVPWCFGWGAGKGRVALRRRAVKNQVTSLVPGLSAWDIVFLEPGPKLISAKLRGGSWVAGVFSDSSFASAPAGKQKELVLEAGVQVDDIGQVERDDYGTPVVLPGAVVLNYADVELMVVERT